MTSSLPAITARFTHLFDMDTQPTTSIQVFFDNEIQSPVREENVSSQASLNILKYLLEYFWEEELKDFDLLRSAPEPTYPDWYKLTVFQDNYHHRIYRAVCARANTEALRQHEILAIENLKGLLTKKGSMTSLKTIEARHLERFWVVGVLPREDYEVSDDIKQIISDQSGRTDSSNEPYQQRPRRKPRFHNKKDF